MLTIYKNEEPIVYQLLNSAVENKKCSHAYLFEIKNNKHFDIIMSFVKKILCPYHKIPCENEKCSICEEIKNNIYPDIKIIEADGMWIKKQQVNDLKLEFSNKSINDNKRIYIIKNCEKLNSSSANSMLKFLEDPENEIIAILTTNNINSVIKTISSRCQIIRFKNNAQDITENDELKEACFEFIKKIEKKGYNAIVDTSEIMIFLSKGFLLEEIMNYILKIYKEIFEYISNKTNTDSNKHLNDIIEIANINDVITLSNKIKKILSLKEQIKYNMNTNLFIDKFLIEMEKEI